MIFEILYIVTALLWALFSVAVNRQVHPEETIWHHLICFVFAIVLCPIFIALATWKHYQDDFVVRKAGL
jgi:hypothetical protein